MRWGGGDPIWFFFLTRGYSIQDHELKRHTLSRAEELTYMPQTLIIKSDNRGKDTDGFIRNLLSS